MASTTAIDDEIAQPAGLAGCLTNLCDQPIQVRIGLEPHDDLPRLCVMGLDEKPLLITDEMVKHRPPFVVGHRQSISKRVQRSNDGQNIGRIVAKRQRGHAATSFG